MGVIIDGLNSDFEPMKYWTPPKNKNLKDELNNMIYSNDYCLSQKKDGYWFTIIKDNKGELFSRPRNKNVQGGYTSKIEWIPHIAETFKNIPNGTVLIGEIYLKNNEQSKAVTSLLGCLKDKAIQRQEKGEKLTFYIFDCLAFNGHNISQNELIERVDVARMIYDKFLKSSPYIEMAEYIEEPSEMMDYIASVLEAGGEGVVVQRKDNPYEFGKRTAHHSLKVKKELDREVDCFLTGNYKDATWEYKGTEKIEEWQYWFHIKDDKKIFGKFFEEFQKGEPIEPISKGAFYGWAGSIEIGLYDSKKQTIVPIGWISNISEEVRQGIVENNEKWKYKVVKINAMMIEEDSHKLRHSKIIEWRNPEDKSWKDCDIEQIF